MDWKYALIITNIFYSITAYFYNDKRLGFSVFKAIIPPLLLNIIGFEYVKRKMEKIYKAKNLTTKSVNSFRPKKPFEHYIPKGQFIDDNDFLLKIMEIQNNNNNNTSKKISYWKDYLKKRIKKNTNLHDQDIEKFIKGKKYYDKDGNYELIFNVVEEYGVFNLHKAGRVGSTIETWDHNGVNKTLYSGYNVYCEIGAISENDDDFNSWDGFSFFPAMGLMANLPLFDEFEFQTGMTNNFYSFSKFCEFLSEIEVIDYNALDDEKKQNLCIREIDNQT